MRRVHLHVGDNHLQRERTEARTPGTRRQERCRSQGQARQSEDGPHAHRDIRMGQYPRVSLEDEVPKTFS